MKTYDPTRDIEEANPCPECGSKSVEASPINNRVWSGWVVECKDCGDVAEYDEPEDPSDPRGM